MRGRDTWVLLATIVGSSLAFIDSSVVTLALPRIQHDFHASADAIAWIVELYALVIGSFMLLAGSLADRFGRKRVFVLGTAIFTAGSIGCAFAWSIPSILAMRVVQALGGMLLTPASLAIIGAHFAGEARGRAVAAWSAFGALTSSIGPMAGGALIDAIGWRSVFWINVPLAAIVLYAAVRHVEESRDENAPRQLDYAGALLVVLGLGGMTYALLAHAWFGWVGVPLLAWFVLHELRSKTPLVPPAIFASRTFSALNVATFLLYGALSAMMYEVPFAMIQGHGYTAFAAALGTLPFVVPLVVLPRLATGLTRRLGLRTMLTGGPLLVAVGFCALALFHHNGPFWTSFFPGLAIAGIGMGFTVAPLTNGVIGAAGESHVGVASGINTTVARVAGLLAIAVFTVILSGVYQGAFSKALDAMHATPSQRRAASEQRARLGGARFHDRALQQASLGSFSRGFEAVAFGCAALALLSALVDAAGVRERRTSP